MIEKMTIDEEILLIDIYLILLIKHLNVCHNIKKDCCNYWIVRKVRADFEGKLKRKKF